MNTATVKRAVCTALILFAVLCETAVAERVRETGEWTERFEVSADQPVLEIWNIWGDVRVLPGPDGEITLNITEDRSAPSTELFDRSLDVYGLNIETDSNGVIVRVGERGQVWRGSNPCRRCRAGYGFVARVPANTRVLASTVNDGSVEISDIDGPVSADNVNGPVEINNASACESVESVNGDVTLGFNSAPGADCSIETINGDISIRVPDNSGMDIAFDLNNGHMTTELPIDPIAIPAKIEHRESGGGHQYRIQQAAGVRLAGGGPVFKVTSMNGDLRIRKIK